jgi:hypothetical protein
MNNIAAADALMGLFGFKRVNPKYKIDDYFYVDHAYRKVIHITASEGEYLYELQPYPGRLIPEGELE